jgi:site-specific DNA-methyltransferase (adenine-specific)
MIEIQNQLSVNPENGNSTKPLLPAVPSSEVYLEDCVTALKRYADNHFDLAIVDPPYGIGADSQKESYSQGKNGEGRRHRKLWEHRGWDENIPTADYWEQLFRVSKNQIVWGGNYMTEFLQPSKCWLIWDKMQEFTGSDFEMAWTSFDKASKAFRMSRIEAYSNNNKNEKDAGIKIHPTQKPTKLYEWILKNYTTEGDLILDTHLGSGSSRIAAYKNGFDFTAFEIDAEYYEKQEKRFNDFKSQLRLF